MCQVQRWMQNPIFAAAGQAACEQFASEYVLRSYPRGEILINEGEVADNIYIFFHGTVRAYHKMNDGRGALVRLLSAPSLYGFEELFHSSTFMRNVSAVEDIDLAIIPGEVYLTFLQKYPAAMAEQMHQLAMVLSLSARFEYQMFASAEERAANVILAYADLKSHSVGDDIVIDYPLTQQELAQSIGAVQRSVANVIAKWKKERVVTKCNGKFIIHRYAILEELAGNMRGSISRRGANHESQLHPIDSTILNPSIPMIDKFFKRIQSNVC